MRDAWKNVKAVRRSTTAIAAPDASIPWSWVEIMMAVIAAGPVRSGVPMIAATARDDRSGSLAWSETD